VRFNQKKEGKATKKRKEWTGESTRD